MGVEGEQNSGMLGCIPASSCVSWSQVVLNEAAGVLSIFKAQQDSPPALVLWEVGMAGGGGGSTPVLSLSLIRPSNESQSQLTNCVPVSQ